MDEESHNQGSRPRTSFYKTMMPSHEPSMAVDMKSPLSPYISTDKPHRVFTSGNKGPLR